MTLGEKLLALTAEYMQVKDAQVWEGPDGNPGGRSVSEIAADYEQAVRELLTT